MKEEDLLAQLAKVKKQLNQNNMAPMVNFYSYLHKRDSFFRDEVSLKENYYHKDSKTVKDKHPKSVHEKYEIRKIDLYDYKINNQTTGRDTYKEVIEYFYIKDNLDKFFEEEFFVENSSRLKSNAAFSTNELGILSLKLKGRLTIGLGSGSVFETAITLHHIYGFPYIPASSFKGVLRSFIIQYLFGAVDIPENQQENPLLNAECRAYQNESFCRIFGCSSECKEVLFDEVGNPKLKSDGTYKTVNKDVALKNDKNEGQEHIGDIVFFDVYPTRAPKIVTDIMNPHYPKYYNGDLPPADWQSPIPILFLTVEDTPFQFLFGIRKGVKNFEVDLPDFHDEDGNTVSGKGAVLDILTGFVKNALKYHGIGAKTAVGYGYFT